MANVSAERATLETLDRFPTAAIAALGRWRRFCELGAVSPDYPYLDILSSGAKRWADRMHYTRPGEMIKAATRRVRTLTGGAQEKALAWLLGYTVHVVMDVTVHPVINAKVGPYEENKTRHRDCEMNQDVYIFQRRMNLLVRLGEFLDSGIRRCSDSAGGLDTDIKTLWTAALQEVHPRDFTSDPPNPDAWHRRFGAIVDTIESTGWFEPISRHILGSSGAVYPHENDIDEEFVRGLPTPTGDTVDFDDLFDRARVNVLAFWDIVARGVLQGDNEFEQRIGDWNLDTGRDDATGELVFW